MLLSRQALIFYLIFLPLEHRIMSKTKMDFKKKNILFLKFHFKLLPYDQRIPGQEIFLFREWKILFKEVAYRV